MGLMQGLQTGFNKLGKAAGQAIDETRIQVELMGARRRKDTAARDLGYQVYRVTQGATTLPGEQDHLVQRIADIEKQIEKLEGDLKQLRVGKGTPPSGSAKPPEPPPPAPPAEPPPPPPPPPAGSPSPTPETPRGEAGAGATME